MTTEPSTDELSRDALAEAARGPWGTAITEFVAAVDPEQLLAHPLNARRHPGAQRDALRESLGKAGWVDVVKVNVRTGHVLDGHARVEEAISAGSTVPVLYVDLDEQTERYVLATLDPISALATYDSEVMAELLQGQDIEAEALRLQLEAIAGAEWDTPWNPGGGGDDGDGEGDENSGLWPTVAVKCPPAVYRVWLDRLEAAGPGAQPHAVFAALLDLDDES